MGHKNCAYSISAFCFADKSMTTKLQFSNFKISFNILHTALSFPTLFALPNIKALLRSLPSRAGISIPHHANCYESRSLEEQQCVNQCGYWPLSVWMCVFLETKPAPSNYRLGLAGNSLKLTIWSDDLNPSQQHVRACICDEQIMYQTNLTA